MDPMTTTMLVEFQAPNVPPSINTLKGMHHRVWSSKLQPWRDLAWVTTRNRVVRGNVPWLGHRAVRVQVELPFAKNARRDPHNYTGTVVKAIVDGVVKAGLVPDDTAEWVEVLDPVLTIHKTDRTVRVTITERNPSR